MSTERFRLPDHEICNRKRTAFMWIRIRNCLIYPPIYPSIKKITCDSMQLSVCVCVFMLVRAYLRFHSINGIINDKKSDINGAPKAN